LKNTPNNDIKKSGEAKQCLTFADGSERGVMF